ncbi:lipid-A-disaccharide synthase [Desulfovibrio ferrophilus]|uniref:Lipid-A-disaccharide synthase n=1 Tax=Desulfovibrio ferrophilus TaxID=241368 RepID=A0A2Z6AZ82_9BACT|nr:lipid-A-disaccharide synthase [Desulfovibrio ferrophilus]BBD08500.1 lipid-A-disaccharide synthase [Desulfovibrio ferrophilus]
MIRKIWINCSEASGDMCAGALARELLRQCPTLEIGGMGGPVLAQAGANVHFPMSRICFSGFWDVFCGLPGIFRLQREIAKLWEQDRPDAIVMVDCPDFNLPLAKTAHAMNIPVYYFMAPQFWAWKQQGMKNMQRYVHNIICALPFEPEYFHERGCRALYAGHPLLDVIPLRSLDKLDPDHHHIGIMPGSRKKEISFLLPDFASVASRVHQKKPWVTFSVARAPGINKKYLQQFWPDHLPMNIVEPEERYQMIRKSCLILAASGTATLETALIGTPTIVSYKIDRPAAFILRKLAFSKFVSLTNILFQKELFPEYLQEKANAESYYQQIIAWLNNPNILSELRNKLQEMRHIAGPSGGIKTAAETILAQ